MATPEEKAAAAGGALQEETGLDLDEWVALVDRSGLDPLDQPGVRNWLKDVHGLPPDGQWAVARAAAQRAGYRDPTPEQYADEQYAGATATLRPIFDALRDIAVALGDDVRLEGRPAYVRFVRRRPFAAVAPATATRVDLGLRFTEPPLSPRLTGHQFAGATHTVPLTSVDEVDAEVVAMLQEAYDQNG